jgi:hypothetical protein
MWRLPEEIQADLGSRQPARIAAGLRDLAEAMDSAVDEFNLSPFGPELLAPFGSSAPAEVQQTLARILAGYRSFQPPLDPEERCFRMAELAVIYGDDRVAMDASMELKMIKDAPAVVGRILHRIQERGLRSEREVTGAGRYLSYLLDGKPPVRQATLLALEHWNDGLLHKAVEYIRPQIEDGESQRLRGWGKDQD